MTEKKWIELKHGETSWVFHLINEIEEEMLEKYGMGSIEIKDNKLYFTYYDGDDMQEFLQERGVNLVREYEGGYQQYLCSCWAPMTFDISWNKSTQTGYAWPNFKFKNIQDFRVYQREFYKYKRQSKENSQLKDEWYKNNKENYEKYYGDFMAYKIDEFALTYCDLTEEERERIKKGPRETDQKKNADSLKMKMDYLFSKDPTKKNEKNTN